MNFYCPECGNSFGLGDKEPTVLSLCSSCVSKRAAANMLVKAISRRVSN